MRIIACFGDSLIQGFPFTSENSWIAEVEKRTGISMMNYGYCGECCDEIRYRVTSRMIPDGCEHILFLGGMNDLLRKRPVAYILKDMDDALQWSLEQEFHFCLVLPWFCEHRELNLKIKQLRNEMTRRFEGKCLLLDFQKVYPAGVQMHAWFFWDGVHPQSCAYQKMGEYAAPILEKWLKDTAPAAS